MLKKKWSIIKTKAWFTNMFNRVYYLYQLWCDQDHHTDSRCEDCSNLMSNDVLHHCRGTSCCEEKIYEPPHIHFKDFLKRRRLCEGAMDSIPAIHSSMFLTTAELTWTLSMVIWWGTMLSFVRKLVLVALRTDYVMVSIVIRSTIGWAGTASMG